LGFCVNRTPRRENATTPIGTQVCPIDEARGIYQWWDQEREGESNFPTFSELGVWSKLCISGNCCICRWRCHKTGHFYVLYSTQNTITFTVLSRLRSCETVKKSQKGGKSWG